LTLSARWAAARTVNWLSVPDLNSLVELGLLGLFLAAFLAGSVLPFPSEIVLVALVATGTAAPLAVGVATVGNVLGAVTVYGMGYGVARGLLGPRLRERYDEASLAKARERIERWGAWSLLLSWVPIVGDTLVLGAGLVGFRPLLCLVLVTVGKLGRYAFVAWVSV
jgi:membrane protein YqaA with SNARE-associated domain